MRNNWFYDRHGTRREYALTKWHQLLFAFRRYHQEQIPWSSIERLVFVCSGNICRSAFAESVAKSIGIKAASAGVYAIENAFANEQAITTARAMGYDLVDHRTTPIMYLALKKTDLLVVMEPWQAEVVSQHLASKHYTTMLGVWGVPVRPHITDPFNLSPGYFDYCFKYIEKSVYGIAGKLSNKS